MAVTVATIKDLREQRRKLTVDAAALLPTKSPEDEKRFEDMHAKADDLLKQIRNHELQLDAEFEQREADLRAEERASRGGQSAGRLAEDRDSEPPEDGPDTPETDLRAATFRTWLRTGVRGLNQEQRQIYQRQQESLPQEVRALASGIETAGGFLIPDEPLKALIEARAQFGAMRRTRAEVIATSTGADIPWPMSDDTANEGELLGENRETGEKDPDFKSKTLKAYTYSSKMVKVPFVLLQDQPFDLEGFLMRKFGERIGRITNRHFTSGDAASKPEGVAHAAVVGKTAAATNAVTVDELLELKHGVDPDYREMAQWMFHDDLLLALKKLKDSENRPLWQSGVAVREPDTFDGDTYVVNQQMATPAASAITVLYGDFSHFKIRDVGAITMLRLVERYAEKLQVAFLAFSRHDSLLADAGTHPIKSLKQAAS
jgi:HK97 family phage major capsid protein